MKTIKRKEKSLEKKKNPPNLNKTQFWTIRVGENLFNRISKHIETIKKCDSGYSRTRWINEALQHKLKKEIQGNALTVDKFINTRIDLKIVEKIKQQVRVMKKFNYSFSKQKWVLEALSEKLEEDEQLAKNRLKKLIVASKKEAQNS